MKSNLITRFATLLLLVSGILFFAGCEKEEFTAEGGDQTTTAEQTITAPDFTDEADIETLSLMEQATEGVDLRSSGKTLIYSAVHNANPGQWNKYWIEYHNLPDPTYYKLEIVVTPISGDPYLGLFGYLSHRQPQYRDIRYSNGGGVESLILRKSDLWSSESHAMIGVYGYGHYKACYRIDIYKVECCAPEDCISFNPHNVTVKYYNNLWLVVDGNHSMFSAPNKAEAERIAQIIRYYGLNQSCFVGRPDPSFQYMLRNGQPPVGGIPGEDCIPFNPDHLQVVQIGGRWKIVEGNHILFDFEHRKDEAIQTLCLIRQYGFTKTCYVGRPYPSLQYMRK